MKSIIGLFAGFSVVVFAACGSSDASAPPAAAGGSDDVGGAAGSGGLNYGGHPPVAGATDVAGAGGADTAGAAGTGAGGANAACLDATAYSALATVGAEFPFCVVGVHATTDSVSAYPPPTWGRHGGPLAFTQSMDGGGTLTRYSFPKDATAAATSTTLTLVDMPIPAKAYAGNAADVGPSDRTLLSYTTAAAGTPGEAILVGPDGKVSGTRNVNGFFSAVSFPSGGMGKIGFTGLSPLSKDPTATNANGLYASGLCGDDFCDDSAQISLWGQGSGPIAVDAAGNAFVSQSSFDANEVPSSDVRKFAGSDLLAGTATDGTDVITAAPDNIGTLAVADGYLFIAAEGPTYAALPIGAYAYTDTDFPMHTDTPDNTFTAADPKADIAVFGDGSDNVVVLIVSDNATTMMTTTTFLHLQKR